MARSEACGSCGTPIPPDAAFCPRCGAGTGAVVVEGVDDHHALSSTTDVEVGGRGRWTAPLAVVGAIAVVAAAATFIGSGDRNGAVAPATTTTTSTSTTTVAPSTTTPAPTTSTTVPIYREEVISPPLSPVPLGVVLYAATSQREVLRIDVDANRYSVRRTNMAGSDGPDGVQLLGRTGGVVMGRPWAGDATALRFVGDGPDGVELPLAPVGTAMYWVPATDPNELWLVDVGATPASYPAARRVNVHTGATTAPIRLPQGLQPIGDDGRGSLLVLSAGGTYRVLDDGRLDRLAEGLSLVAVNASIVVEMPCDAAGACSLDVIDRATGKRRTVGPAPDDMTSTYFGQVPRGTLSPDGSRLARMCQGRCGDARASNNGVQVIDLATGATSEVPAIVNSYGWDPFVWSADGRWLFWADAATGGIRAWTPGAGEPLDLRLGDRVVGVGIAL